MAEDDVEIIDPNNEHLHVQIGDLSERIDQFKRQETLFNNTISDL